MFDQVAVGILQTLTVVTVVVIVFGIPLMDTLIHKK